jgi:hypothetical protein
MGDQGELLPPAPSLHGVLTTVLRRYASRGALLEELLAASELARERQPAVRASIRLLQQCVRTARARLSQELRGSFAAASRQTLRHFHKCRHEIGHVEMALKLKARPGHFHMALRLMHIMILSHVDGMVQCDGR